MPLTPHIRIKRRLRLPRLDRSKTEIRLLKFDHSPSTTGNAPAFRCQAVVASLETHVHVFTALSYEWGASKTRHTISYEEQPFRIRENLYRFLRRWVQQIDSRTKLLWIDQLSIDQDNLEERAEQVEMMDIIYGAASQTIVWLGVEDGSAIVDGPCVQSSLGSSEHRSYGGGTSALQHVPKDGPWWIWLRDRTYWTRLWIVQELILSQNLVIWFGQFQLSWEVCTSGLRSLYSVDTNDMLGDNPANDLRKEHDQYRWQFFNWLYEAKEYRAKIPLHSPTSSLEPVPGSTLADVLLRTGMQQCSNPLDTVFAVNELVLLASDRVKVDYSMRAEDLLSQVLANTPWKDRKYGYKQLDLASLLFLRLGLSKRRRGTTLLVPGTGPTGPLLSEAIGFKIKSAGVFEVGFVAVNPDGSEQKRVYNGIGQYRIESGAVDMRSSSMASTALHKFFWNAVL